MAAGALPPTTGLLLRSSGSYFTSVPREGRSSEPSSDTIKPCMVHLFSSEPGTALTILPFCYHFLLHFWVKADCVHVNFMTKRLRKY